MPRPSSKQVNQLQAELQQLKSLNHELMFFTYQLAQMACRNRENQCHPIDNYAICGPCNARIFVRRTEREKGRNS